MDVGGVTLLVFAVGTTAFWLGLIGRRGLVERSAQDARAHMHAISRSERVRTNNAPAASAAGEDDEASMSEEYDVESLAETTARFREAAKTRADETQLMTAVRQLIVQQQQRHAAQTPSTRVDVQGMAAAHLQRQRDEMALGTPTTERTKQHVL